MADTVRVLRVIEYVGPREMVERQIELSLHGVKRVNTAKGSMTITAATVGEYPELLQGLSETTEWSKRIEDIKE